MTFRDEILEAFSSENPYSLTIMEPVPKYGHDRGKSIKKNQLLLSNNQEN